MITIKIIIIIIIRLEKHLERIKKLFDKNEINKNINTNINF